MTIEFDDICSLLVVSTSRNDCTLDQSFARRFVSSRRASVNGCLRHKPAQFEAKKEMLHQKFLILITKFKTYAALSPKSRMFLYSSESASLLGIPIVLSLVTLTFSESFLLFLPYEELLYKSKSF